MDKIRYKNKFVHHNFYKHFRKINGHLIDKNGNFEGG